MDDPLLSLKIIKRFIHLGNVNLVFVTRKRDVSNLEVIHLKNLLKDIDGQTFVTLIGNCIKNGGFVRKDELWFTYALYLSEGPPEDKKKVKDMFPIVAITPEDLFLFVKYSQQIHSQPKSFSKTTKKAITLWYKSKSQEEMVEYLGVHRGMHGYTHRDLITICHINLTELNLDEIALSIFKRCNKFVNTLPPDETNLPASVKRIAKIYQLKYCEDVEKAKKIIMENDLQLEHIPQHLLMKHEIWELLIPTLKYEQLLNNCSFAIDTNMFTHKNFEKLFLHYLGNVKMLQSSEIHPYSLLVEKSKQLKPARYSEKIKACFYARKVEKHNIHPHKPLLDILVKNLELSFSNWRGIGCNTFVTINLQQNYEKRPLKWQTQVSCYEAAVAMAFSYFKSEEHCVVYSYSDGKKLSQIPWLKEFSLSQASNVCKNMMNKKNGQRLCLPLEEAQKLKHDYDLFIIIAPSLARGNPQNKPEKLLDLLNTYKKRNKKTKIVLISLNRTTPAMIHDFKQENGILEIIGLNEKTPKIIEGFVSGIFS